MNWKMIFGYSFIFLSLMTLGVGMTVESLTNIQLSSLIRPANPSQSISTTATSCSSQPKIAGIQSSNDPYLTQLSSFQTACRSFVSNRMMIFSNMPKDAAEAQAMADKMAKQLQTFAQYGVQPVVIVEPTASWGPVNFEEFNRGLYTPWINTYFKTLKDQSITDQQMGIWVPFPEANLPYWDKQDFVPEDFGNLINIYVGTLKSYFPAAHASILLNSTTYDNSDLDFANGEYLSLVPWIQGINKGMVDSFGIQGFPWLPRASTKGAGITDADEFLDPRLATEAADKLGVKEIWFNTGTFYSKYTNDSNNLVTVDPSDRKAVTDSIVSVVSKVKKQGYTVWVNIFAQDKSEMSEATDWSYWKDAKDASNPYRSVFVDFAHKLLADNIRISLFDEASTATAAPSQTPTGTDQ